MMMTVKELIEYLSKCNPEYTILLNGSDSVSFVIEHKDVVDDGQSFVEVS